jgi:hypothetical protein
MNRSRINSSVIYSVGYDEDHKILEVEFADSKELYQYLKVPKQEFEKLLDLASTPEESVGKYFNSTFKAKYDYKKLL